MEIIPERTEIKKSILLITSEPLWQTYYFTLQNCYETESYANKTEKRLYTGLTKCTSRRPFFISLSTNYLTTLSIKGWHQLVRASHTVVIQRFVDGSLHVSSSLLMLASSSTQRRKVCQQPADGHRLLSDSSVSFQHISYYNGRHHPISELFLRSAYNTK